MAACGAAATLRPTASCRITVWLLTALLAPVQSVAATDRGDEPAQRDGAVLQTIVVTATRQPRELREVAATVTLIDGDRLQRDMVFDLRDLARSVPALQVESGGSRFGTSGFRVRGIGGNRVTTLLDGVPLGDRFAVGSYSDSGRDLLSLGMVSSMEVLRGPASTLYGSKALGGVVAIRTFNPDELLDEQRGWAGAATLAHAGHRDQVALGANLALGDHTTGLLLSGGRISGSEVRTSAGGVRDPQREIRESMMLRYTHETQAGQRVRASLQGWQGSRETDLRSVLGSGRFATTQQLLGDDDDRHWRAILDGEWQAESSGVQVSWRSYLHGSRVVQDTDERRGVGSAEVRLQRRFDFAQNAAGVGADVRHDPWLLGDTTWRFAWGTELRLGRLSQFRDGRQTTLATGATSSILLGERFPLRDFPESRTLEGAVYMHQEIEPAAWPLTLLLGLRHERYRLSARPDEIFREGAPNVDTVDVNDQYWTPKLAVIWQFSEAMSGFAQYVRGYRSPPFSDVNIGLDIPAFNVRALPNPDLSAETSDGLEAGLRLVSEATQWNVAVFNTWYRDFIVSRAPLGPDPQSGVLLFQSRNLDRARIAGVEFGVQHQPRWLQQRMTLELGGIWLHARSDESSNAISLVDPAQLMAAAAYALRPALALRFSATAVRGCIASEQPQGFRAGGHALLDLTADWQLRASTRVRMGVFNLADREAWRWSEVIGRTATDPMLPQLSLPGRYVAVTVQQTW
ncbi:MAG: TonB-dependent receptor [Gammaproteobacteria bacterium]|nr:TonB-dependent receptor [Gammaproteobacteria bacterium]